LVVLLFTRPELIFPVGIFVIVLAKFVFIFTGHFKTSRRGHLRNHFSPYIFHQGGQMKTLSFLTFPICCLCLCGGFTTAFAQVPAEFADLYPAMEAAPVAAFALKPRAKTP
jgi:hypothetical protein